MSARMLARSLGPIALFGASAAAMAAGADLGQAVKQPTNWTAIGMFAVFVIVVAAAEVAVALAIVLTMYRLLKTVSLDQADTLRR